MGALVLSMFTSLDGYISGPNGEFIPPQWSDDLDEHWSGYALKRARHLLYGRVNFLFNKDFWSAADTDPDSPAAGISYSGTMNRLPKLVLSTTLRDDPGWNGMIAAGDIGDAVAALKVASVGDIFCFGGAGAAQSLVARDLVDEYRIMVTPNLLGNGKRLFEPGFEPQALKLRTARTLDTGAVVLHYDRVRG